MSLTLQNLRAVGIGVEPTSLLPGQIAFNITEKVLFVGDGSSFKTNFDGTQIAGTPGNGWYSMPMDFDSLGEYYVANPGYYGDVPTDQQVLAWSTALNHPIWITGTGGGGSQVYIVTNAQVAIATGVTTSDKISSAIGVVSPDEGNVAIVTGLPDDVYEGLYFFTTEWVKGAAYAYPSAYEVIYDNTGRTLGATVQLAINNLDDGLIATTAIANTANSTANSALSIASAALPRTGGTMTGTIVAENINVPVGYGVQFGNSPGFGLGTITGINDSINTTSSTTAASATAVKAAYDIGAAALARSGGTMTGTITFAAGQLFPISGIDIATAAQLGVVQIGTNIQVALGVISVGDATVSSTGIVQLNDTVSSTSITQAATARVAKDLQDQIDSLTLASNVFLAGSLNATTGLLDSTTTLGSAAGFVAGSVLPAPSVANTDYYVLTTVGGSYSPPGGGGPYAAENGDWFLSNGTIYQYLGVGARPQSASYIAAGIVQLADTAVTYTGTSDTEAITPNSLQDKLSNSTSLADNNRIASSTAVKSAYDLAAAAIPCSVVVGKGAIVTGSAVGVPTALPVGTNGQVLAANSTCATGLEWVTDVQGDVTGVSGTAPITVDNTNPQTPVVGINAATTTSSGAVQLNDTTTSTSTSEAATANAVKSAYDIGAAAVPCSSFVAKGNLLGGTGVGTYSALSVGTDGQFLSANSALGTGLQWCTLSLACVPCSAYTAIGTILAGNGPGTFCSLSVGTSGQVLVPNSSCAAGVEWRTCQGVSLCGFTNTAALFNTALGFQAGDSIITGSSNVTIGYAAGSGITSGTNNTFVGNSTGDLLTNGNFNTALGSAALGSQTGGNNNTAIGQSAGSSITTGQNNTLVGQSAGSSFTTASGVTAIGYLSGRNAATGTTAVGCRALQIATGVGNTAVGLNSGACTTTGTNNTFLGFDAGGAVTIGGSNVLLGARAGCAITTGTNNTVIGDVVGSTGLTDNLILAAGTTIKFQANAAGAWSYDGTNFGTLGQFLASNGTVAAPSWCTLSLACVPCAAFVACGDLLVGTGSATFTALSTGTNGQFLVVDTTCTATGGLKWVTTPQLCGYTNTAGLRNTALGSTAGDSITSGVDNTSIGFNSGTALTTGTNNTLVGACAGDSLTTGTNNVVVGKDALSVSTTGTNNIAIGIFALGGGTVGGGGHTAIGHNAGFCLSTGFNNTLIAQNSGDALTTGSNNVAVGFNSLSTATTTSGSVAIGNNALQLATTGANNTAVGFNAGAVLTSGGDNTMLGNAAGDTVTTGTQNTFVGSGSGGTAATTAEGNTALGFSALGQGILSGSYNIGVGNQAGVNLTSGTLNTLVGFSAGSAITTGGFNTLVGRYAGTAALSNNVVLSDGSANIKLQINQNGAIGVGTAPSFGTASQILQSNGTGAANTWVTPQTLSTTATKAVVSATPIGLLSWASGVRMGDLTVMATDNSTNYAWANITIASDTGVGSSVTVSQAGTFGTFAVITGGGGETIVEFTPSATLAAVDFVYKYTVSFGAQPTVL